MAQVWHASTTWHFGTYVDQLDAARERDKGVIKLKGWDADNLHFPVTDYRGDEEFCRMVSSMTDEEYRDAAQDAARAKSATAPSSVGQRLDDDEVVDRVIDELLFDIDNETYVGIRSNAIGHRWIAQVYRVGITWTFGGYDDAVDAARARDKGMIKLKGWDADNLNFPRD
eukprot:31044-Pelagococcus_subviridis.AAC.13